MLSFIYSFILRCSIFYPNQIPEVSIVSICAHCQIFGSVGQRLSYSYKLELPCHHLLVSQVMRCCCFFFVRRGINTLSSEFYFALSFEIYSNISSYRLPTHRRGAYAIFFNGPLFFKLQFLQDTLRTPGVKGVHITKNIYHLCIKLWCYSDCCGK